MSTRRTAPTLRSQRPALLGALVGVCLLTSCFSAYRAPKATYSEHETAVAFPDDKPRAIEISVRHGHVLLQHGPILEGDALIRVRADEKAVSDERLEETEVVTSQQDGVCYLRVTHAAGAPLDSVDTRLRLRVPSDIQVRIIGLDTQVAVRGFRGNAAIRTERGAILASPDGGECDYRTDSGIIRLSGRFASAKLATNSGGIDVTLPRTYDPIRIDATSETGPVHIDMCETCSMSLDYVTRNGDLQTDFPVQWDVNGERDGRSRVFRGRVGDAGDPTTVTASVECTAAAFAVRRLTNPALPPER